MQLDKSMLRKGRAARLGLVALVLLSGILTAAALFAQHKLDTLRASLIGLAESRTGADIELRTVSVSGVRAVRIEGLRIHYTAPDDGLSLTLDAPTVYFYADLGSLLRGSVALSRIDLDGARLHVGLPPSGQWGQGGPGTIPRLPLPFSSLLPVRFAGRDCSIDLSGGRVGTGVALDDAAFDLALAPGTGILSGNLSACNRAHPASRVDLNLSRFSSLSDFDARAEGRDITTAEIVALFPKVGVVITAGAVHPRLRVQGEAGGRIVFDLASAFEDVVLQLPRFPVSPQRGSLRLLGSFERASGQLVVANAKLESEICEADASGSVKTSDGSSAALDVNIRVNRAPISWLLNPVLEEAARAYGSLHLEVPEPVTGVLVVTGTVREPDWRVALRVPKGGTLAFSPTDSRWPTAMLQLGVADLQYGAGERKASGTLSLLGGDISLPQRGIAVEDVMGTVMLDGSTITIAPVVAKVTGSPWWGEGGYDLASRRGQAKINGTLSRIEETPLFNAIKETEISGKGTVTASVTYDGTAIDIEGAADATETQVAYEWWYLKPAGLGATGTVKSHIVPGVSAVIDTDLNLIGSNVKTHLEMRRTAQRWALISSNSTSDRLDIGTVGQCLRLPYKITGGTATSGVYNWVRESSDPPVWKADVGCSIDSISMLASGGQHPMVLKGVTLNGLITKGPNMGTLNVSAEEASMPPVGDRWFVPMRTDPVLNAKFPPEERAWSYQLAAASLSAPPWKGTAFKGEAYLKEKEGGLDSFATEIDGGRISGSYHNNSAENAYETILSWNDIPVHYFLEHLKFPEALSGQVSGNVRYSMDRDDPSTQRGSGTFTIAKGQFNADFILAQLQNRISGEAAGIPPSLAFSTLRADVAFKRDHVETKNLLLESEGVTLSGNGGFVRNGDMDYDLKVAISPELAVKIPAVRDSITVEGHRLAQQNIELAFKVTGPTFRPRSQVSETSPISVTLVSGALAVTSELIDFPRKILVDLLKIGGGIMGAGK